MPARVVAHLPLDAAGIQFTPALLGALLDSLFNTVRRTCRLGLVEGSANAVCEDAR